VTDASAWQGQLYRNALPEGTPAAWTAIPYFLWANRDAGAMRVWVPED
jgi:DUF1680 family protein